jgi:D-amino-acid dehydrogenase
MRVIVIGAGLLGLTTAYFLRRHGLDVVVLERRSAAGLETSYANGGMLHASQANPWNEPGVLTAALRMLGREDAALLVRLKALPGLLRWGPAFIYQSNPLRYLRNFEKNARLAGYSLVQMAMLRDALGSDYDFQQRGTIKLFRTREEVTAAARLCAQLDDWGIRFATIDPAATIAIEPALSPIVDRLAGGLHFPDDEAGDAHRFCTLLADDLQRQGVEFRFDTIVERLSVAGARGPTAYTANGDYAGHAILVAAGSYTPRLTKTCGLRVPVAPVKGYSLTVPFNGWTRAPQVPVIDDHLHAAVCPLGDRLRIAGTAEFAGYDLALTPSRIENLFGLVTQLYPDFAPFLDRRTAVPWAGLRPMSSDGVGIMGRTRIPGLYLNTGHGPLGWTMAAGAGKLVADEIAGQNPELPLAPYYLER